jgi:hypothetical protein
MTPTREIFGTASLKSWRRLLSISKSKLMVIPVRLPPGRARLVTRPVSTGLIDPA